MSEPKLNLENVRAHALSNIEKGLTGHNPQVVLSLVTLVERLEADNAALVTELRRRCDGHDCDKRELSCVVCAPSLRLLLAQPHPGAALLAERAALKKELELFRQESAHFHVGRTHKERDAAREACKVALEALEDAADDLRRCWSVLDAIATGPDTSVDRRKARDAAAAYESEARAAIARLKEAM